MEAMNNAESFLPAMVTSETIRTSVSNDDQLRIVCNTWDRVKGVLLTFTPYSEGSYMLGMQRAGGMQNCWGMAGAAH